MKFHHVVVFSLLFLVVTEDEPFVDSGSEYAPSNCSSSESEDRQLSEHEGDKETPVRNSRKKRKNEEKWKRNIRKRKRAAGKEYENVKGNTVTAKRFEDKDCPCLKKCHLKFSQERREILFKNFYALGSHTLQTAYIFGQVRIQGKQRTYGNQGIKRKENTRVYFLSDEKGEEHQVCKEFFKQSLGVSDGRITRALITKKTTGTPKSDQRGKSSSANKTSYVKTEEVKNFINKFPVYESHYSRAKNPNRKYLSPDLDITKMYNLYKMEVQEPVSMFVFRRIFNTNFNLKFHAPLTDSCRKCDAFEIKIKAAEKDSKEYEELKRSQEIHHRKAEAARMGMKRDAEAAKLDNDLTVISFDLMKTLATPVISTGVAYYKRQLWTFCFGIHDLQTDATHMYMWDESVASRGPQEIGSCIAHYIKNNVATSKLVMYSDQCGGQNRNFKMAAVCTYIVSSPDFTVETIDHKFLVSGHSYLPNDQDFGLIEKNKKHYKNIYVPSNWVQVVSETRKRKPFNVVVMTQSDFFSTKGLEKALTHRKTTNEGDKVQWLHIQWLHYIKNNPGIIYYKYSNNEDVQFYEVNMKKRGTTSFQELASTSPLFDGPKAITIAKYNDLLSLLEYIPPVHHNFYRQLLHNARAEEDASVSDENDN